MHTAWLGLKPVDDRPCLSIACLFVDRDFRNRGVSTQLLRGAVAIVREREGKILEGYPVEPKSGGRIPAAFSWTGVPVAFEVAGLVEVARRLPTRPIMRNELA
ncbi:MAG: GNAT family N-acetyltransferase [Rhodothermales bacterium]